jgi:hypothetical protein
MINIVGSYLRDAQGFGEGMIGRFFRPFYQGIFLAPLSEQSSRQEVSFSVA